MTENANISLYFFKGISSLEVLMYLRDVHHPDSWDSTQVYILEQL